MQMELRQLKIPLLAPPDIGRQHWSRPISYVSVGHDGSWCDVIARIHSSSLQVAVMPMETDLDSSIQALSSRGILVCPLPANHILIAIRLVSGTIIGQIACDSMADWRQIAANPMCSGFLRLIPLPNALFIRASMLGSDGILANRQ